MKREKKTLLESLRWTLEVLHFCLFHVGFVFQLWRLPLLFFTQIFHLEAVR